MADEIILNMFILLLSAFAMSLIFKFIYLPGVAELEENRKMNLANHIGWRDRMVDKFGDDVVGKDFVEYTEKQKQRITDV